MEVLAQLQYQEGQAVVWRDGVASYFHKLSGIADTRGRVGNYPGRVEAESAVLKDYTVRSVAPPEGASGEKVIDCPVASCTATFKYSGDAGWRDITVRYFDVNSGAAKYRVRVAGELIAEWTANDRVPTRRIDSASSARRIIEWVLLRPGDE